MSATGPTSPNTPPAAPTPGLTTEVVLPGIVEPEGLQIRTRELAAPGPGQVRVAVEATGVSFAEQQMLRGKYYDQPPFPFVPGYDLVGTVTAVGPDGEEPMVGRRYAAVTKVGAWASEVVLDADDLVEVPGGVDPAAAATLLINGATAYRMLYLVAEARPGQTILVLGANGGVGNTLVQLARRDGIRVIGTASLRHHDALRALGAEPVDYRDPDVPARVRELAPHGVDAVFDHVGGPGIVDSYRLLGRGGTLVSYGTASTKNDSGSSKKPILTLIARLLAWNLLPNGHKATFFNFWVGRRNATRFRAALRADLTEVLQMLARGEITPQIAARLPLSQISTAMRLAESGTVTGKVVIEPQRP
jgi:2-desacetyl-2-hydroxyethyl bacteriochlorophyllide A dehydrogenase